MPIGIIQTGIPSISADNSIYQLLTVNGNGTGTGSQNVNGSSTPVLFYIQPESNEIATLRRMNVEGIDGNFNNASQYGALGAALTNGIKVYVDVNGGALIKDYTKDITIKRNHDWALLAGVDNPVITGAGSDALIIRWTFALGGGDIVLDGSKNERLVIEIQDNLTGLTDQLAFVQGFRRII